MIPVRKWVPALVAALLIVGSFALGTAVVSTNAADAAVVHLESAAAQVNMPEQQMVTDNERVYAEIYNRVSPSVVAINVVARRPTFSGFNEFAEGTGTGFVIDTQGHIVTNYHVVDGATRIEVNFFNGRIVRGEVVGLDPDSDLAVLQVHDIPAEELIPVTLGDSNSLFVGQEVVAIGSPFNQDWTMTTGIISALNRSIQGLTQFSIGSVIQTDAAINPGNSGGPLLNLHGEVIGVNTQIISQTRSNTGVGFAIPSNLVQRVATQLINNGRVDYSYLGIGGDGVNLYLIDALGLPNNTRGVVVTGVQPGSPAAVAGLQNPSRPVNVDGVAVPSQVDIITAIDGTPVNGMPELVSYLASNTVPGQTVNLTVLRNGRQELTLPVTLGSRPTGR